MKKYILHIPEPCHEHWDNMPPSGKGRHCQACDKVVVDFTGMKDEDLVRYLLAHKNICGRLKQIQLNRPVYMIRPRKKYHWPAIAAMIVAGILQVSAPVMASPGIKNIQSFHISAGKEHKEPDEVFNGTDIFIIKGTITDENKEPVPFASVALKKNGVVIAGQEADMDGKYEIRIGADKVSDNMELVVSAVGWSTMTVKIPSIKSTPLIVDAQFSQALFMGMIEIVIPAEKNISPGNTIDADFFDKLDLMTFPR